MNWLGTELVWNFHTKLTFLSNKMQSAWKVSHTQMPFLVSDLLAIRKLTWGGYPRLSLQPSWFTATRAPNHQVSPFQALLLELLYLVLLTGNVPQDGEKSSRFDCFPGVMEGTKDDNSYIVSQHPHYGLLQYRALSILPSWKNLIQKVNVFRAVRWRPKFAGSILAGFTSKSPKSKGIQQHLNHSSILEKAP